MVICLGFNGFGVDEAKKLTDSKPDLQDGLPLLTRPITSASKPLPLVAGRAWRHAPVAGVMGLNT